MVFDDATNQIDFTYLRIHFRDNSELQIENII